MKRVALVLSGCFLMLFSCKDTRLEGLTEDKIGFLKDGGHPLNAYIASKEIEFEASVYKSGIGKNQTRVTIEVDPQVIEDYNRQHGTTLEPLSSDAFSLENENFIVDNENKNAQVKVRIDVKKLEALQGIQTQKYAVPLRLKTTGEIAVNEPKSTLLLIPEVSGGIRSNSAELLWSKTLEEMGVPQTNHFTASFAVTTNYLFVNTRTEDLRYFDRYTGEYIGSIPLDFKGSLTNFTVTSDEGDNLLISNLRNAASGEALQTIYRIKGTGSPEKYIELWHTYPNGRKISITGDLDSDAIITSTVENSSKVLYWKVNDGILQSQEPQVFTADATRISWAILADAVALDVNLEKGMFIAGSGTLSALGHFNSSGEGTAMFDLAGAGLNPAAGNRTQALAMANFNGARYLAVGSQSSGNTMHSLLLDVTKTENLQLNPSNNKIVAFVGEPITTISNANSTADIHLKVSKDKSTMVLYSLGTNGGITAVQFDNKGS